MNLNDALTPLYAREGRDVVAFLGVERGDEAGYGGTYAYGKDRHELEALSQIV